ncbi:MAG: DNA polymerase/3'-5' exonuclease PolX [Spirochaetales bacterium]|nr:DNA polymerase/3'-5' exonuclease PolX [Spirochaetales bacterium]
MENREIAAALALIAVYKELAGENAFKTRAFENVARAVEGLAEPLAALKGQGRLREIPGVGESIAGVIAELVDTGASAELEKLRKEIPGGLLEILELQGVGPKKARALWHTLGITTLDALEEACRSGAVRELDGFGAKSEEKILAAVEFKRTSSGFFLYDRAYELAGEIKERIEESGLCPLVEVAGSLRRGKDTVKDADILAVFASEESVPPLRKLIVGLADPKPGKPGERDVIGEGDTKVSVRRRGLQVDVRLIPKKSAACALQYFTGSKTHNTQLRSLAKALGYKVNEYEISGGSGEAGEKKSMFPESEEDLYRTLGLDWVPPELREGEGEIEAAREHRLPRLVALSDFRGLIHCHTTGSDGALSLGELVAECRTRGLEYLCLSDHSPSAAYAGGLSPEDLARQAAEVEALNKAHAPFRIFHGTESDIRADGSLDYPAAVLDRLDFVIGAVHSRLVMPKAEATERLCRAIADPHLTILAHPSGRLLLQREGYEYDSERVLAALAEHGVALEHNCHPARFDPDWRLLKKAAALGIVVSVDPDLHSSDGFDHLALGCLMARKAWLGPRHVLNCLSREEIDEYFKKRKERRRVRR